MEKLVHCKGANIYFMVVFPIELRFRLFLDKLENQAENGGRKSFKNSEFGTTWTQEARKLWPGSGSWKLEVGKLQLEARKLGSW